MKRPLDLESYSIGLGLKLQHLIDQTLPSKQSYSTAEYLSAEDEVPVCVGRGNDWEIEQLHISGSDAQEQEEVDECAQECRKIWIKNPAKSENL